MTAARVPVLSRDRPFPGLRPFELADRDYFCGRESHSYALYLLVRRSRFTAVVGSSGSGKSSLVQAGLLPLLEEESDNPGGQEWRQLVVRPRNAPIAQLTKGLAGLRRDSDELVSSALHDRIAFHLQSSRGISEALSEIGGIESNAILLLVDQFEELFRFSAPHPDQKRDLSKEAQSHDEATRFVELLLEAGRSHAYKVHVLLTMRSDFIGDCARFQGLPEAVSAAQFLVPSLPREHREEVICRPLALAGATIEPELVERLLNDSSDELDQLPVLQHCLLRLWEKAGASADASLDAGLTCGPSEAHDMPVPISARHLTVRHYDDVGRMANALSRHADEIMSRLPGRQRAVQQTFRALSEIDKDGRAIRRGATFEQLCAETGIPAPDLREVLDRFRADDCSFLTPSPSAEESPSPGTLIDVGHEALLRRWGRVSGTTSAIDSASKGWLRAEADDGQNYRRLLATRKLHPKQLKEDWPWWTRPPRTPAWTERYGGHFDRVDRLLRESHRARSIRRAMISTTAAIGAVLFLAGTVFVLDYVKKRDEAKLSAQLANEYYERAKSSAMMLMDQVQQALNAHSLPPAVAQALLETAEEIFTHLTMRRETPDIAPKRAALAVMISDVYWDKDDRARASELAEKARDLARPLVRDNPDNVVLQHLLFRALFRIADVAAMRRDKQARQLYGEALEIIEALAARQPSNFEWKKDSAFIYGKLGDISQGDAAAFARAGDTAQAQERFEDALKHYTHNEDLMGKVVASDRGDNSLREFLWKRDYASATDRVGQALKGLQRDGEALAKFSAALTLRLQLFRSQSDNAIIQTHVAVSHRNVGDMLMRLKRPDEAIMEYRRELAMRGVIADSDPGNTSKQVTLARTFERVGDELKVQRQSAEALRLYHQALLVWRRLVKLDGNEPGWQQGLQAIEKKIGSSTVER